MNHKNSSIREQARALLSQMTLDEKISLCSGADCWHTRPVERLGLAPITFMDGPHGLRKQIGATDNLGIGDSVPAVCFPAASALACSFDRELVYRVGEAIGQECVQEDVSVVLGPGINQKRSPLCGRNFEYFSEDPILSGELGASMIRGIQSTGTQASLKHFAVNNQEKRRMTINAVVDERALRETYLKAFEIAVKKGSPGTVMCAYNRLEGTYCCEHQRLLTSILRDEWGFEGAVVSDWGAVHDRVEGVKTGMDIEMPGSNGINDHKVLSAIQNGSLSMQELDTSVLRTIELALKASAARRDGFVYDPEAHHRLAVQAAEQSAVLLRNEGHVLPGNRKQKAAVIGAFAKAPRYQGAGSSKINPIRVDAPWNAFLARGMDVAYAPGYSLRGDTSQAEQYRLIGEACEMAAGKEIVYLFIGMPEGYESEGFDRQHLRLPDAQNQLVEAVCSVNHNVAIILIGGAPMELPWAEQPKAVLLAYLCGEGMGEAVVRLLMGESCPCGKLAETWPLSLADTPAFHCFPGDRLNVEHRESIFVGYRYYDKADRPVRYPFGYGLSYTTFAYSNLSVSQPEAAFGESVKIRFTVQNTGKYAAKETALVFVGAQSNAVPLPIKELREFVKVSLEPGEARQIECTLRTADWGYYNTLTSDWYAPSGEYLLSVGPSVAQCPLQVAVRLTSPVQPQSDLRTMAPSYFTLPKGIFDVPAKEFEALLGHPLPPPAPNPARPYTVNTTVDDIHRTLIGRIILLYARSIERKAQTREEGQEGMLAATIREMPFFAMVTSGDGMISEGMLEGMLDWLNGHPFRGLRKLIKG